MLDSTAREGLISYHPRCKKLGITHLCLSDDLAAFTSAAFYSLLGIKSVLDKFYLASGLSVSYGKSEIYYCGVSLDMQLHLVGIVGLNRGTLPVRY